MHHSSSVFHRPLQAAALLTLLAGCGWEPGGNALAQSSVAPVAGFTHVRTLDGIQEYTLDSNGLTVLIKPDHSAPVVNFQVVYRVGSRNEVTGTTGSTHLLEHLMFKGSDAYNDAKGNSIKQYLESVGAGFNATTSSDRTNYFGTLGKDHLEGYIAIESDRMRNLWLREEDRQAEMTVVRNEYERGENNPGQTLYKEVMATAYQAHPYHHSVIGWRSDIENVPIGKLRAFYDTYYWPNNATVTMVGDIEPAAALQLIKKYYGGFPHSPQAIPQLYTKEPPQQGPRRVILKRPGQLGVVMIAYKGPDGLDADMPALDVLGAILSSGKNSRLYRALTDKGLVLGANAGIRSQPDPGLFMASGTLAPGIAHEQVEKALIGELERVKVDGVTQSEIDDVISQQRAGEAYGRDGVVGVANGLESWITVGDWTYYVTYIDKLAKVTPADVQRVAKKYLNEDQSTTGWFVPVAK